MVTKFLVFVALAATGWVVVDGSSRQPVTSPPARLVAVSAPVSTVTDMKITTLEVRQDPVPLVRQHTVPLAGYVEPATSPPASAEVSAVNVEPQPQAQDTQDMDAARIAAEADGYKRVSIVGKGSNGTWRVKGYRGATEVLLTVDGMGRVFSQ